MTLNVLKGRKTEIEPKPKLSYEHDFSWSYRQILAKSSCTCYLNMIKSLVSFGDLDLIFKVTMRYKLKYLSKIMTSVPNLLNQTVNFIWIYTNIFNGQDNEIIGDLDLFASVTTGSRMLNANLHFKLPHDNSVWQPLPCKHINMDINLCTRKRTLNAGDLDPIF